MSVDLFHVLLVRGAAWSLLLGCIICSKQHCCWPCSCTMLPGSILTPYSIVLCLCRFLGLDILFHILWPVYSVYSVAKGCSMAMLNHILMTVMQWQIQHQAMRNPMILTFLSRLFHLLLLPWQSRGCSLFSSAATIQARKLYTHPGYSLLISYVLAQARPTMIYIH